MKIKVLIVVWFFSILSVNGNAQTLYSSEEKHRDLNSKEQRPVSQPYGYVRGEIGYSVSLNGNFQINANDWTVTNEGYNDDVGNSMVFGLGMGMVYSPILSVGLSAHSRTGFSYSKHQTIKGSPTANPNLFFPDLNGWTRTFDLENQSYMVDVFLNRAGKASPYLFDVKGLTIIPYLGGSIGLSVTRLSDFHTVTNSQDNAGSFVFNRSRVIMTPKTANHLGWQVQLGLDVPIRPSVLASLGYRYFDGGTFKSNDYATDLLSDGAIERTYLYSVSPWKARLRSNEIVASLTILI